MDGARRSRIGQIRAGLNVLLAAMGLLAANPAIADDRRSIDIIDIHQGSALSDMIQSLPWQGYELADHSWQSFDLWYGTTWRDLSASWLLQLDSNSGIIFGLSTGERGEKYQIEPSLKLGVIGQGHPRPNATLSLSLSTTLWGILTENPCTASYGPNGSLGTYDVNCRLAAGELAPEKTLKYLFNEEPSRLSLTLTYRVDF